MWNTPGGEDGLTRAQFLEYARQGSKVPDLTAPFRCLGLIGYYNNIRSFAGVIDNPVTMSVILDWQKHTNVSLEKWERDSIFAMDAALRRSYADVVKYHAQRKQVKHLVGGGRDKDWRATHG